MYYFDNAATTKVDERVLKKMVPYFTEEYGNASSIYKLGRSAREAVDRARSQVAKAINAKPEEIVFTSGGTESDNFAIKETYFANPEKKHIIVSAFEHPAVLNNAKFLKRMGVEVTILGVGKEGIVDIAELKKAIRKDTLLVSIMHANNEIGTIQPIAEIGKICKEKGVIFHTDAVQTFGKEKIDVEKMNIDLLSGSAHKIYGPKGEGFLYVRKGTRIVPMMHGGGHEHGMRSGTENVPGIVGLGEAAELAIKEMKEDSKRTKEIRDFLFKEISKRIAKCHVNGDLKSRLSGNVNISFDAVEGEAVQLLLNEDGFAVSTGSACSTGSLEPSHVLMALGVGEERAHSSIRITVGRFNTMDEAKKLVDSLEKAVSKLRSMSPFWKG